MDTLKFRATVTQLWREVYEVNLQSHNNIYDNLTKRKRPTNIPTDINRSRFMVQLWI